jgi:NRPS condensation-like uncharacterized protein
MRYRRKEGLAWRKLDDYAKLFPLASTKKYKTVFRISAVLKDTINPEILEKSVKVALNKFKYFKVRMRKGIFWYYFENNTKSPIIEEENDYPCKFIDLPLNNDYLFKVTYFENKINLEIFHCLTDGSSATHFLKEIIYNYIEIKYLNNSSTALTKEREVKYTTEDIYEKNYDKRISVKREKEKAYNLKGKLLPPGIVSVTHEFMSSNKVREVAKSKNATITQFLTATLIYAIHEEGVKKDKSRRKVKIQVPVNLKKYFPSATGSNSFSYIDVNVDTNKAQTFDNILEEVKKQFAEKLTEQELLKTIAVNVRLANNFILKFVPLFIKKFVVSLAHKQVRKYNTTTLSNIGRIGIISEYKPYIDKFLLLIAPESVEKIKCTICAYEDIMVFSFASVMEDKSVEYKLKEILEQHGIEVQIDGNEVL